MTVTVIPVFNFKLTLAKSAQTMLFLGLFSDKRLEVKQMKITSKTKSDKYIEI